MRSLSLAFAVVALLAACEFPPPSDVPPPAGPDDCGASGYQSLIGTPLAAVTLPAGLNLRVIKPGDIITMDFNPRRLNMKLDRNGRIVSVYCG